MSFEPIVNLGSLYVNGCQGEWASNTTRTIAPGQVRDSTNTFDIVVSNTLTVSGAFNGVGGLDTGTLASSTFYAVYVIYDPTQINSPALLLSTSFTNPIMPSLNGVTYGAFRLLDFVLTDGSAHFLKDYNFSTDSSLIYKQYDLPLTVLGTGNATTITSVDLSPGTGIPVDRFGRIKLQYFFTPNAASSTATLYNIGSTNPWFVMTGQVAAVNLTGAIDMLPEFSVDSPKISYNVSSASSTLTLTILGYEFYL